MNIDHYLNLTAQMKLKTWKQAEVSYWVSKGLQSTEIARRIGISTRGVKERLRLVYRHLGIKTRVELIGLVLDATQALRLKEYQIEEKEKEHGSRKLGKESTSQENLPSGNSTFAKTS